MGRKKKTIEPLKSFVIKYESRAALKAAQFELKELKELNGYDRNIQGVIEMLKKYKEDLKNDKAIIIDFKKRLGKTEKGKNK